MMFQSLFRKKEEVFHRKDTAGECKIITILRVRNEELILEDTLNHLGEFSDAIVAYDDCSDDATFDILYRHPKVAAIIKNLYWADTVKGRLRAETAHRKKLTALALQYHPEWLFCADADERYVGDIRGFVESEASKGVDGVRLSLFDAYLTADDHAAYTSGKLLDFRKYFGIERRDILMMWRASAQARYKGLDRREPHLDSDRVETRFYVQHYGKALSERHWEETCNYYIKFFPYKTYGKKWEARKGKAVHTVSDFGTPLYAWGEELFSHGECIHPQ